MAGGVTTTHSVYDDLKDQWQRCRDCSLGSDAVKYRKTKYLPALDSHKREFQNGSTEKYSEYLLRALFYNATGRTVQGLSGAIFQKAPSVVTTNIKAEEDAKDITLTGQPIDLFALNVTKEYLVTGRYGILVDMSTEEATTPRPYWVGYSAEDIINWRFEKMGGDQELSLVVLREYVNDPEPEDEFCPDQIIQYRVLRLKSSIYTQQVYQEKAVSPGSRKKEWVGGEELTPTRKGAALDFIPFALPWAVNAPPLLDLTDVNLAHFRGTADLKHGLHYTALPTPWVSGLPDNAKPLAIGSGTAWALEKEGRAGMLEFTGKGLGALREDLQDMQKMMATLGARLLEEAPHYAETALSVAMRHSSDYATLRMLAQVVEQQLTFALQVHCWWIGNEKLVAEVQASVELNKVFYDQSLTADELRALLLALQADTISYKTFYARIANTGWTREGVDSDEELKDIKADPITIAPDPKLQGAKPGTPPDKTPKPVAK